MGLILTGVAALTYLLIRDYRNRSIHLLEETQQLRLQSALEIARNDLHHLQGDKHKIMNRVSNIESVLKSKFRYER